MDLTRRRISGSHARHSRLTIMMDRTRLPEDIQALNARLKADPGLTANMGPVHILTVKGRRSGKPRATPVSLVVYGGDRWLVAGWADADWVKTFVRVARPRSPRARRWSRFARSRCPPCRVRWRCARSCKSWPDARRCAPCRAGQASKGASYRGWWRWIRYLPRRRRRAGPSPAARPRPYVLTRLQGWTPIVASIKHLELRQ